jgi:hypothetical protein
VLTGRFVRFAPEIAGSTEGKRASGKVPEVRSEAEVVAVTVSVAVERPVM